MDYIIHNGELYHSGVKGMKWGIRRYQNKDGSLTPAGKKRYAKARSIVDELEPKVKTSESGKDDTTESAKKSTEGTPEVKRKSVKKMTDDEIRARMERLELEKDYKELEAKTISRGKKFAMDVIEASGKNISTQLMTYMMGTGVNAIAKKIGVKNAERTVKDAAGIDVIEAYFENIVNPRKGQKDK